MQPTPSQQLAAWVTAAVMLVAIVTLSLLPGEADTGLPGVVDAGVRRPATALCLLVPNADEESGAMDADRMDAGEAAPAVSARRC